jgi:hypothetical protein
MDWIKKHADQFSLALLALLLLVLSVLAFLKTQSFAEGFSDAQKTPTHSKEVPPVDNTTIATAEKQLTSPTLWVAPAKGGSVFVSKKTLRDPNDPNRLIIPGLIPGRKTHPPIEDDWLIKYDLDIQSATVKEDDPDKDGFSNLDEFLGADRDPANWEKDATDPRNKDSHPPYYTKLFLGRQHLVPFRLLFNAYDNDPKKVPVENISFQINTLDLRQPSVFLKLGEMVPNTKYKLLKFEPKTQKNEGTGFEDDASELVLQHEETKEQIVLVYQKTINSPTYYAVLKYFWPDPQKPKEFAVKKGDQCSLEPDTQEKYKLEDVTKTEAIIELPGGGKYTAPLESTRLASSPATPADGAAPATPPAPSTPPKP